MQSLANDRPEHLRVGRKARIRCAGGLRQAPEELGHESKRLGLVEIPGDDERRVPGHVVRREERLHVLHRRGLEVLVRADDGVVVGVPFRKEQLWQPELGLAVGLIFARLAALVAHDLALRIELLEVHLRTELPEAIGLEPEQQR